jgi:DNA-binding response OmpR family regulator
MATRILVVDDSTTIRRVVSMILERHGYETAQATDGQDALDALVKGEVQADLVLVDFVMPRMNGFQFCRALRQHPELQATPVVLMSAKGDRIRDQFVQQTGAIDAITKPFDAQALVVVVENALRRIQTGYVSSARLPELELELDPDDVEELSDLGQLGDPLGDPGSLALSASSAPPSTEVETKRMDVTQLLASRLAAITAEVAAAKPGASAAELLAALRDKLGGAMHAITELVREHAYEGESAPVMSGDLSVIPVGAVLQLLQVEAQTGILVCRNGNLEVSATFRRGFIDLVQSTGTTDEFRLGRYFVEEGILTPGEIDALMTERKSTRGELESEPAILLRNRLVVLRADESSPATTRMDPGARPTLPSDEPSSPTLIADVSSLAASSALRPPSSDESIVLHPGGRSINDLPSTFDLTENETPTRRGNEPAPRPPSTTAEIALARPLGTMLLDAGRVTQAQLEAALGRQSSELLYDVLRWSKGRFELRREPPSALAASARLGLPVASVVMEGFRRVDEWRVLERTLGSFDAVLVREEAMLRTVEPSSLPARETTVLDLVDGVRTVRGIVTASHMSSFDACRILVQFLEARLVRRRVAV